MMYHRMKELARVACVNVMAYDYSGYGLSTGEPSQESCFQCITAAYAYLRDVRKIPPEDIVLYGRSVGTGPTCYLAAKTADEGRSVAGVILHSPFLSIFRIVVDLGFSMTGDMFRNIEHAPRISCPVLIIHGTEDNVVPFWHGQELLKKLKPECRAPPYFAAGMGHNNIEVHNKDEYVYRLTDFLHRYIPAMLSKGNEVPVAPIEIPEDERGNVEGNHSRWINETWVKHGAGIVREALHLKRSSKQRETTHMVVRAKTNQVEAFEEFEVVPGSKMLSRLRDCDATMNAGNGESKAAQGTRNEGREMLNNVGDEERCDETLDYRAVDNVNEARSRADFTSQEVMINNGK